MGPATILLGLTTGALLAWLPPRAAAAQAAVQTDSALVHGRRLTTWLLDGQLDSLYPRMAPGFRSALGGRTGLEQFLQRVGQLGSEIGNPREVVYRESGGTYYYRIGRFERAPSVTSYWIWDTAGTIQGLLVQPTPAPAPSEFTDRKTRTPLRLPFDGQAYVAWGGREAHQNYHVEYRDQRYAYDFFLLEDGKVHAGTGARNEDYACFGRPILAPGPGTVRVAVDSVPDNSPRRMNPQVPPGNHVIIDHGRGEFSVLAHLRQGSLRVQEGQRVQAADPIGTCGNSGNSSAPHLHYHLQTTARAGGGVGLPARFLDYRADGRKVAAGEPVRGQTIQPPGSAERELSLERIFGSGEFQAEYLGPVRWVEGTPAYARLEPDSAGGRALVRYDAATGRREVWVAREPAGAAGRHGAAHDRGLRPRLPDGKRLLVFTNTRKVWRYNTRGDYWVLDLDSGGLRKLGGDGGGGSDADVRQVLARRRAGWATSGSTTSTSRIWPTAHHPAHPDGSRTTINGTFDWVYEEELSLRDGWRWSPDGTADRLLAAGRQRGARLLPGQQHRLALLHRDLRCSIPRRGPPTRPRGSAWFAATAARRCGSRCPAIPATTTSPGWSGRPSSGEVLIQHLNRAQNTIQLMLGDAATGRRAHGAHRAGQRLAGRGGRRGLARRRPPVHLGQRARRLAPRLRGVARRAADPAGHLAARST